MALRKDISGRVLVLTLDDPPSRNALDTATMQELRDLLEGLSYREPLPVPKEAGLRDGALQDDPDIGPGGKFRPHVVVLRSAGPVFCAGAHLGQMEELGRADFQTNLEAALDMGALFRAVRNFPAPVVARVQGPAYGGGVGLAAACDVVVAGPQAKFTFTEVRLGLVPGVISPLVVDRIGLAATRRYFLTGDPLTAEEAARLGLVDVLAREATEPGKTAGLDAAVERVVGSLLSGGPEALNLCKSLLEGGQSLGFDRSADFCARMIAEARAKPEAQAALPAFFAGRPAPWIVGWPWRLPPLDPDRPEGQP